MRKVLLGAMLIGVLLIPATTQGRSKPPRCQTTPCVHRLQVGQKMVQWVSPQRFAGSANLAIGVWVDNQPVGLGDGGRCNGWIYGHGLDIAINTCGDNRPIRLRLVSTSEAPVRVRFSYRLS